MPTTNNFSKFMQLFLWALLSLSEDLLVHSDAAASLNICFISESCKHSEIH